MYENEKNVPPPLTMRGKPLHDWPTMAVGDSVFVPTEDFSEKVVRKSLRSYHRSNAGKGRRFVTRQEATGLRVWRV